MSYHLGLLVRFDRTAFHEVSRKQVKIAKCYYYKYTLFVRIVREWNKLPRYIVEAENLRRFKANGKSYVYFTMSHSFKIGHAKSVRFRFESAVGRSDTGITSRYLEITLSSFSNNKYLNLFEE